MSVRGVVYLLHLDEKVGHAQHYIGWTSLSVVERVQQHIDGEGAAILREATRRNISPECVRVWENETRAKERQLKNRKNGRGLCPICLPGLRKYERDRRNAERRAAGIPQRRKAT